MHAPPAAEPEQPTDLMAALRASLEAAQRRRARTGPGARAGAGDANGDGDLARLSKDELLQRAREADVKGRSQMSKEELVAALERAA